MNDYHMMKAMGYLPTVECKDVDTAMLTPSPDAQAAVKNRGCFTPDFPDEEIAKATDAGKLARELHIAEQDGFTEQDGVELATHLIQAHYKAHKRQERTSGSGSFPAGCDSDWPDRHVVTVRWETDTFPNDFFHENVTDSDLRGLINAKVWGSEEKVMDLYSGRSVLDVAWDLYVLTYIRVGVLHKRVESGGNIVIRGKRIPGSTIGYAYFNNGECSDQVDHFLDTGYRPGLRGFIQLVSHEGGHNNNLDHEFRRENYHQGIMSYTDPDLYWGFSTGKGDYGIPLDPSREDLARYYGTEPFPFDPTGGNDPDPVDPVDPSVQWPEVMVKVNGVYVPYVPKGGVPDPNPDPIWEV